MKILIETYGCQMNVADSELMQGIFRDAGFEPAGSAGEADVVILNTCAVREKAEARIFGRLTNLLPYKRAKRSMLIGVTGCMAKHLGEKIIKHAPYVDFVVGPDRYRELPEILAEARTRSVVSTDFLRTEQYEGIESRRPGGICAWLTIQRGCNYVCSYCIVPFVRGAERAVPSMQVLAEARRLVGSGFKVITLLGQTVNSYDDGVMDFTGLLRELCKIEGLEQIRFTSPHPLGFSDALCDLIISEPKIAKFVHLPLQSASDSVLERMGRGYCYDEYLRVVRRLRAGGVAVSTDIIVGFCGETDAEYAETRAALAELRFDFAFLFAYSERSLSVAARKMKDDVPASVKQERLAELIAMQQEISREVYESYIGQRVAVLIESESKRGNTQLVGNSSGFKTTLFERRGDFKPGDWVEVEVKSATSQSLIGEIVRGLKVSTTAVEVEDSLAAGISLGPRSE